MAITDARADDLEYTYGTREDLDRPLIKRRSR
jgi:hypothetical protein